MGMDEIGCGHYSNVLASIQEADDWDVVRILS